MHIEDPIEEAIKLFIELEKEVIHIALPERQLWASVVLKALYDIKSVKTYRTAKDQALEFFLSTDKCIGSWQYCKSILNLTSRVDKIINEIILQHLGERIKN